MIDDRKVKVNKRGKVIYTHDPYKKKKSIANTLKKFAIVGIVSGVFSCFALGFGGAITLYSQNVDEIQEMATVNKYEEKVDNYFVNNTQKMSELEKYMANSEEVTKEEYMAFLKTKGDLEFGKVFSLSTGVGGGGLAILSLATYIGAEVAEDKRIKEDKKKKAKVYREYARYDDGCTRAELDIPLCNQIDSPEKTEERKTR